MNYVPNSRVAAWYGPPCRQPTVVVSLCGSGVRINQKAERLFRFQDRCFRLVTPNYYSDLSERHLDDWGYNCRPVTGNAGPVTISNASKHAWALATDIDADENVRGTHEFDSEIWNKGKKAVLMLEEAGFTWGGRFSTPDPHHFEVAVAVDWIESRFDKEGLPRPWFAKRLEWPGKSGRPVSR